MARTRPLAGKLHSRCCRWNDQAPNVKRFGTFEVDLARARAAQGRHPNQASGSAVRDSRGDARASGRCRDARRVAAAAVAGRYLRRFRAQPECRHQAAARGARRRCRQSAVRRDAARRGYRFIAAVEGEGQPVRNLHVVRPAAKPAPRQRQRRASSCCRSRI